jgi:hypothetical protein
MQAQAPAMPQPPPTEDDEAAAMSSMNSTWSQHEQNERGCVPEDLDDTVPSSDDKKRKKKEWKVMLTGDLALEIYKLRPPLDQVRLDPSIVAHQRFFDPHLALCSIRFHSHARGLLILAWKARSCCASIGHVHIPAIHMI